MKLIWNTHIDNSSFWGEYHRLNSKMWIFDLLKNVKIEEINDLSSVKTNDSVIIVDSELYQKKNFYNKFFNEFKNIYLFHLGDEGGRVDTNFFYSNFKHIFRTFYLNSFSKKTKITCIPIGYKSGLKKNLKKINERKYVWNFLGTIHGASRYDLIHQNKNIKPHYLNITNKFNANNSLSSEDYYKIMGNTIFSLVSHGYYHPETYRLYESIESGCIPIIENPHNFFDLFLPNNPMIKINLWKDASEIIKKLKNDEKQKIELSYSIQNWWEEYKKNLRNKIEGILNV